MTKITDGHRQIADRLAALAASSRRQIGELVWKQDEHGEFLTFHLNGERQAIDVTDEEIEDYSGDDAVRQRINTRLQDVLDARSR
jgi:hypothetical protein